MVEMQILKSHEEWLKSRTRIGGSDAAAIVGLNPWLSNQELYDIKTGSVVPGHHGGAYEYTLRSSQYSMQLFTDQKVDEDFPLHCCE